MRAISGIDVPHVTAWFQRGVPHCRPPLHFEPLLGGRSNLTYRVSDDAGHSWVLRRPPLRNVLPSAHDVRREYKVMTALAGTPVPVPATVGFDDSGETPFYVTDFVEGVVIRNESAALALEPSARRRASNSLADVLAALHNLSPSELALSHKPRGNYVGRQLERLSSQLRKPDNQHTRLLAELHERLVRSTPEQQEDRLIHGDFKLANVIVSNEGEVRAVLDWELSTVGDPLADLGLLLAYWPDPSLPALFPSESAPTHLEGFLMPGEMVDRYASRSLRDVPDMDFYVAFAYWKLSVILEGVRARSAAGAYGAETPVEELDAYRGTAIKLAEEAAALLDARE